MKAPLPPLLPKLVPKSVSVQVLLAQAPPTLTPAYNPVQFSTGTSGGSGAGLTPRSAAPATAVPSAIKATLAINVLNFIVSLFNKRHPRMHDWRPPRSRYLTLITRAPV